MIPSAIIYCSPFISYVALTWAIGHAPEYYHILYPIAPVVSFFLFIAANKNKKFVKPHLKVFWGIVAGVAGIVLWILLCRLNLEAFIFRLLPDSLSPAQRPGFNPFESLGNGLALYIFLFFRIFGLAIAVPAAEELFYKDFLPRFVDESDWEHAQRGKFTPLSFAVVTILFTLSHPEMLAAFVYAVLLNVLYMVRKDLFECMVAHSISNIALAAYVLYTGEWRLW